MKKEINVFNVIQNVLLSLFNWIDSKWADTIFQPSNNQNVTMKVGMIESESKLCTWKLVLLRFV